MVGPDASAVHAQMVDGETFAYRPDVELVGESMRILLDPPLVDLQGEHPIATGGYGPLPQPAAIRSDDLRFESGDRIHRPGSAVPSSHGHNHTTQYTEHIGRQLLAVIGVAA